MKKVGKILVFCIIVIILITIIFFCGKDKSIETNSDSVENIEEGMKITLVAGVALPENGNRNSNKIGRAHV